MYRSLALGLLGACCLLLAMRPPLTVVTHGPGQLVVVTQDGAARCPPPTLVAAPGPTIIDVAPGVTIAQLAELVRLGPGEHIATVDDRAVAGALGAGVALAALELRGRTFLDLGIASELGTRRVLVLLH